MASFLKRSPQFRDPSAYPPRRSGHEANGLGQLLNIPQADQLDIPARRGSEFAAGSTQFARVLPVCGRSFAPERFASAKTSAGPAISKSLIPSGTRILPLCVVQPTWAARTRAIGTLEQSAHDSVDHDAALYSASSSGGASTIQHSLITWSAMRYVAVRT